MWAWIRTPRGSTTTALVVAVILALLWFDPWTRPFGSDSAGQKPAPAGNPQPLASTIDGGGPAIATATGPQPAASASGTGGYAAPTAGGPAVSGLSAPAASEPAASPSPLASTTTGGPASPSAAAPSGTSVATAGSAGPGPTPAPSEAAAPATSAPGGEAGGAPSFDIVRVEPDGSTVVAGRAEPGSDVVLLDGDKPIARAQVDALGQFALLPPALAAGDHALVLQSSHGDHAPVRSPQNVAVSVAAKAGTRPLVALLSPDKPAEILSDGAGGGTASSPAPGRPTGSSPTAAPIVPLAIQAVEARQAGEFLAAGVARPGSSNRVYLNGAFVAEVTAGPNGHWSVEVRSGMAPGRYLVRADQVEPASGKVVNRVEVPFDYPAGGAGPTRVASAAPTGSAKAIMPTAAGAAGTTSAGDKPAVVATSSPPAPGGVSPVETGSGRIASTAAGSRPVPATPEGQTTGAANDASGQPSASVAGPPPTTQTKPSSGGGPASGQPDASSKAVASTTGTPPSGAAPAAPASEATAAATPSVAQDSAAVVVPDLKTKTVMRGDSLWRISRQMLGRGLRYTEIYASNAGQIKDPALIYPGQVFVVPTRRVD